jgi:type IV fimbrial biogenesis protein FimT
MLRLQHRQGGVTLIELMVGLLILGLLFAMGAPAFSGWIQNSRIRTTAEAIQNGLQLARAEAVRRNNQVRFQLASSLDNACSLSTTSSNWVVSLNGANSGDPTGNCNSAPSDTAAPYIIQTRSSTQGSSNLTVAASQSTVAFNGFGRQASVTNLDGTVTSLANVIIQVPDPAQVACAPAGTVRCMQVQVSLAGQIRMCDPALASTDPQGC